MKIKRFQVGICQTNCYVVETDAYLLIIDPGDDFYKFAGSFSDKPTYVVFTHTHFDHVGAAQDVARHCPNAKFYWSECEDSDSNQIKALAVSLMGSRNSKPSYFLPQPEKLLKDNEKFLDFTILYTPGHTNGSICLYCKEENVLFSGDTMFYHSYGRTDLGGNKFDMAASLSKLRSLDPRTVVYPGHGFSTSVKEEITYFSRSCSCNPCKEEHMEEL